MWKKYLKQFLPFGKSVLDQRKNRQFLLLSIFEYSSVLCLNSCKVGLNTVDFNQGFTKYL